METYNTEQAARALTVHFLRSLLKIERSRLGLSKKGAAQHAEWTASLWGDLESGAVPLEPDLWAVAMDVLGLTGEDVVRRLNAFIGKYPSLWMERRSADDVVISERALTSHKALRSGNTFNVDLEQLRPELYRHLAAFCAKPNAITEQAKLLGFFDARAFDPAAGQDASGSFIGADGPEAKRARILRVLGELPPEKLGLLERIVDKLERYPAAELAQAYKHFSLSLSKR